MHSARIQKIFEKPSVWLVLVVVLAASTVVLSRCQNDEWSSFGLATITMGTFGRIWTMGPMEGVERWCRRFLLMIAAFLFLPVMGHQLRTGPGGKPMSMLGHLVATGMGLFKDVRHNFAQLPPLRGVVESKSELLGALRTDYLVVMNTSDKGVFPTACKVFSSSKTHDVKVPEVVKPYDTLKIELRSNQGKIFLNTGDRIELECQGFVKPLTVLNP